MNFQNMSYFVRVAKERSFTKAAEQLYLTQQTLSAQIAALEQELGCQLFIRHIPLKLTYAGEVFLRYAQDFQKKHRAMMQEFDDIAGNEKGILRIGVAYTRGRAIMPRLIETYQNRYPKVEVQMVEGTNDILQQKLLNGGIDLAIANFPTAIPGVELIDFYDEKISLFISKQLLNTLYGAAAAELMERVQQTLDLSLLAECPFLLNDQEDITGRFGRQLIAGANFLPIVKAQSENVETLLELCALGVGACFCPENLANAALGHEKLETLHVIRFDKVVVCRISIGTLKQESPWSMITNFTKLALEPGSGES